MAGLGCMLTDLWLFSPSNCALSIAFYGRLALELAFRITLALPCVHVAGNIPQDPCLVSVPLDLKAPCCAVWLPGHHWSS